MALAFDGEVQQWNFTDSSLTEVITVASSIAANEFVVIMWHQESDNINVLASVSDSAGNTWAVTAASTTGAGYCSGIAFAFMTTGLTGGSSTITLTWTNTSFQFKQGTIVKSSGVTSSSPLDANSTVLDTFTAGAVSIPITTINANDIIFAIVAQQHTQTYTVGGGFTVISTQSTGSPSRDDYLYRIVSSAAGYDPAGSIGAADNYRGSIAAFKAAAGGGAKQLAALGVG